MREYTKEWLAKHLGEATAEYWCRVQQEAMILASRPDPAKMRAEKRRIEAEIYRDTQPNARRVATDDEVRNFFSSMGGYDDTQHR
jgi:hypothetical protein